MDNKRALPSVVTDDTNDDYPGAYLQRMLITIVRAKEKGQKVRK